MAELETIEIVSLKDPAVMWIINATDFDPTVHTLWAEKDQPKAAPVPVAPEVPPPPPERTRGRGAARQEEDS